MERADEELLKALSEQDLSLRRLYDQHRRLEREVARFSQYAAYSPSAAIRASELKKEKLRGMDEIMSRLNQVRHGQHSHHGTI